MTPKETFVFIEAYFWRIEQQYRNDVTMAWLTARLGRAKKFPELKQLLAKQKQVTKNELKKRREEFKEMVSNIDLSKIGKKWPH